MVHPLIHDIQRAFYLMKMGDGVLCQYCNIVGCDQFRESMVDFRVNMIRTSRQNDTTVAGLIQETNRLLSFRSHVLTAGCKLLPCFMYSRTDLCIRKRKFLPEFVNQTVRDCILTFKVQERMDKINFSMHDRIHIVLNIFRVGSNDRAVIMVVRISKFFPLIRDGRIENVLYSLVDEPLHMSVCKLGRITFGFTRDGFDSKLVNLSRRCRRKNDTESQFSEKCKPERIIFIHIQNTRDTDHSAAGIGLFERSIIKVTMQLIFKKVRHLIL